MEGDALVEKKLALENYRKARESIVEWITVHKDSSTLQESNRRGDDENANTTSSSSSNSGRAASAESSAAELKATMEDKSELSDMLQETIDALLAEIMQVCSCIRYVIP